MLVPGETIGRGFKIFRDMFIFTVHRLIMIDKQGLTGSKVSYHSILYRNITQFSVETAGSFDADSELKIWVSGAGLPITKNSRKSPMWSASKNTSPTASLAEASKAIAKPRRCRDDPHV